jgi:hypothetical protein
MNMGWQCMKTATSASFYQKRQLHPPESQPRAPVLLQLAGHTQPGHCSANWRNMPITLISDFCAGLCFRKTQVADQIAG